MTDQPNPWEDAWRDELAGYEAPRETTDWSAMDALLDGGTVAPPDTTIPGTPAGAAAWLKGIVLALTVTIIAGLGYNSLSTNEGQVTTVVEEPSSSVTATLPVTVGEPYLPPLLNEPVRKEPTLAPKEVEQLASVSLKQDVVVPAPQEITAASTRYRFDTTYIVNGGPRPVMRIDSIELTSLRAETSIIEVLPRDRPGTSALVWVYDTSYYYYSWDKSIGIFATDSSLVRADSPRATRKTLPLREREIYKRFNSVVFTPRSKGLPQASRSATGLSPAAAPGTNKDAARQKATTRTVLPWPTHGLPTNDELWRQRLRSAAQKVMLDLRINPNNNNGYFPPIKDQH